MEDREGERQMVEGRAGHLESRGQREWKKGKVEADSGREGGRQKGWKAGRRVGDRKKGGRERESLVNKTGRETNRQTKDKTEGERQQDEIEDSKEWKYF